MSTRPLPPLPAEWVDRLFGKLALRYGQEWVRLWEGIDIGAVKADWAHELAGMHLSQEAQDRLRYGVDNLPADRPPNVAQFKAICGRAPAKAVPQLSGQKPEADPERVSEILRSMRRSVGEAVDPIAWAEKLKRRHETGERLTPAQIAAYQAALARKREVEVEMDQ